MSSSQQPLRFVVDGLHGDSARLHCSFPSEYPFDRFRQIVLMAAGVIPHLPVPHQRPTVEERAVTARHLLPTPGFDQTCTLGYFSTLNGFRTSVRSLSDFNIDDIPEERAAWRAGPAGFNVFLHIYNQGMRRRPFIVQIPINEYTTAHRIKQSVLNMGDLAWHVKRPLQLTIMYKGARVGVSTNLERLVWSELDNLPVRRYYGIVPGSVLNITANMNIAANISADRFTEEESRLRLTCLTERDFEERLSFQVSLRRLRFYRYDNLKEVVVRLSTSDDYHPYTQWGPWVVEMITVHDNVVHAATIPPATIAALESIRTAARRGHDSDREEEEDENKNMQREDEEEEPGRERRSKKKESQTIESQRPKRSNQSQRGL